MNRNGREAMDELFGDERLTEDEIVEQIQEVRGYLDYLEDNPDEMLAMGLVIALTDETTMLNNDDEVTDGIALRMINPQAHHGYRDVREILTDAEAFDRHLENIKLEDGDSPEPKMVRMGALFGGDGPF